MQIHPEDDREGRVRAGQLLGGDQRGGECERRGEHEERGRLKRRRAGTQDHQHADEAEHHGADPARRHAFAQERHREQQRPCRRGELEREHGRERQQQQAHRPEVLTSEMHGIAKDVQREVPGEDRRPQVGAHGRQGSHDGQADTGAHRQDLHDAQRSGEGADRDRHRRERQQRPGHPEHDANELPGCHGRLFRDVAGSGPVRLEHDPGFRARTGDRHGRHSASGWFSGLAWSNAASLAHAASTATSLGKRSSGTFRRRAL